MRKKQEVVNKQIEIYKKSLECCGKDVVEYAWYLGVLNALIWITDSPEEETVLDFNIVGKEFMKNFNKK